MTELGRQVLHHMSDYSLSAGKALEVKGTVLPRRFLWCVRRKRKAISEINERDSSVSRTSAHLRYNITTFTQFSEFELGLQTLCFKLSL